ncbi:MAG: dihydroorotate dehydrogenase-like protein [Bacteroidales bacterium]|jgi:dihydroorotate dehydrogenase (fumarate)|nr:dihydroorotate dehydrogenase-like protein [Bacteroidales bacterium]
MDTPISLATDYAGLRLHNPFIVSSSGLTDSADKVRVLEQEGAAAVVLKSLFEEQIELSAEKDLKSGQEYPEAYDYIRTYVRDNQIDQYLHLIRACKASVSIPIIASINCYTKSSWISFAKEIENAGADAIEVNIMIVNVSKEYQYGETERLYVEILRALKKIVKIPVIIKLSHQLTSPVALLSQLSLNGADAVVLFNRSYTPDVDIKSLKLTNSGGLGAQTNFNESLRWIGIGSGRVPHLDLSVSGGVAKPEDAIKALLVGASTVSLCSVLYKEGTGTIGKMIDRLTEWMEVHGFDSIESFRGILNSSHIPDESIYERSQFMRYYANRK